ncbi:MAG: helix-turn-helix transcriptional regulator [Hyphomicrobium sp.]
MNEVPLENTSAEGTDARQQLDRFISRTEVRELTGLSPTTLWREIRAGRFPAPVALSPNRKAFRVSDVAKWMRSRPTGAA